MLDLEKTLLESALAEAHRDGALTDAELALSALIRDHEKKTGVPVDASNCQIILEVQKVDGKLHIATSLRIFPKKVYPINKTSLSHVK